MNDKAYREAMETLRDAIDNEWGAELTFAQVKAVLEYQTQLVSQTMSVLHPFTHPDLRKLTTGNAQGMDSPVFGRDGALLRLRDFAAANKLLLALTGERD